MSNLVIVAIPEEMDRVWKLSSEKVPHLTLLFLGEMETNPHVESIVQFVEHAVTLSEHGQFYLDVDHRGTLGPDDADVLFFSKRSWNLKWIKQFRGQLLQNEQIRSAYDSVDNQYETWEPHLTMGYPTAPAKEMGENDHPLYSVCFDRIAVWTGDFDGPEFRLEWPDRELEGELAVAYSDMKKAELLHVGVKGMRWGQKKTETVTVNGKSKQVTPKKAGKLDKQWEKNIYSLPGAIEVHNKMAEHFNARIGSVNDKYKNDDFSKTNWDKAESWTAREKQYDNEVTSLVSEGNRKAVEEVHGTSPTGKRRAELNGDQIVVHEVKVQHAEDNTDAVAVLNITRNSKGLITKAEPLVTEDTIAQTAELGVEFLEHYGTKGMRWGQRTEAVTGAAKSAAKVTAKGAGKAAKGTAKAADNLLFESQSGKDWVRHDITDKASEKLRGDLPKIKAKHGDYGKLRNRAKKPFSPEAKAYRKDVKDAYLKHLESSANEMTNIQGSRRYTLKEAGKPNTSKHFWDVSTEKIEHTASASIRVQPIFDEEGYITDIKTVEDSMAQSIEVGAEFVVAHASVLDDPTLAEQIKAKVRSILDDVTGDGDNDVSLFGDPLIRTKLQSVLEDFYKDPNVDKAMVYDALGEAFLEHYGIKGMRWGLRRRNTPSAVTPTASSKVPQGNRRKTKIDVKGGENHPAHEDAVRVAIAKAKLKKSGTAALSNHELRDVATRVQLENQVKLLTSRKGSQFVKRQLSTEGQNLARAGVREGVKKGAKRVGVAALA